MHSCRHDFVVVETIEFDEDEDDELPMLLTQRDVVLMNKAGPLEEDVAEPAAQLANGEAQVRAQCTVFMCCIFVACRATSRPLEAAVCDARECKSGLKDVKHSSTAFSPHLHLLAQPSMQL